MPSYDNSYTYDAVGNRLTKTDNLASETTTSTYDAANQLETSVDASGTTNYNYDGSGNLTEIEDPSSIVTSYSYDVENHRTKVELPSSEVVTSTFNGDGQRVKREDSSETRKFIWDGQAYLAETNDSDVLQAVFTQRPAEFGGLSSLRRLDGAEWTTDYFHFDALGSTCAITDSSESTQETYLYDAWGNLLTASTLEPACLYVGDSGYYADWIEGSVLDYYVRARTYDSVVARWISADPLGFVDGDNLYVYAKNDAVLLFDPLGLYTLSKTTRSTIPAGLLPTRATAGYGLACLGNCARGQTYCNRTEGEDEDDCEEWSDECREFCSSAEALNRLAGTVGGATAGFQRVAGVLYPVANATTAQFRALFGRLPAATQTAMGFRAFSRIATTLGAAGQILNIWGASQTIKRTTATIRGIELRLAWRHGVEPALSDLGRITTVGTARGWLSQGEWFPGFVASAAASSLACRGFWIAPCQPDMTLGGKGTILLYAHVARPDTQLQWLREEYKNVTPVLSTKRCFTFDEIFRMEMYLL